MRECERIKKVLDGISVREGSNVFIIGCENGEIIDYCLKYNVNSIVGVDSNISNAEKAKVRFAENNNVEIVHWNNMIYSQWIKNFDLVIAIADLTKVKNLRQFVRDVSVISYKGAHFVIVCKNEQSADTISEELYGYFMITSRMPMNEDYIIMSIKMPERK